MSGFDAVIFDMDGLLLDTERVALNAFRETCEQFALGDLTDVFMRCVGTNKTRGEQILREGLEGKVDYLDFSRTWDGKYSALVATDPVRVMNGVLELLERLTRLGIPAAVATSTSTNRAIQKLRDAGILERFAAVVGGDQVEQSKPAPDIYLKAAAELGARPDRCLALEDSENGVRSALAAGMTVIQIPDLVPPSAAFRELGHDVAESLHDVIDRFSAPGARRENPGL